LHAGDYTASRITEKFVGPDKHNKTHLLAEKIQRGRAQSAGGQALLHCRKAPFVGAQGKKLYLLVRIETKMSEDQPAHRLKSAAGSIESNCFTPQLLNGFEFGAHDERAGGAWHVTGKDSERSSLDHPPTEFPITVQESSSPLTNAASDTVGLMRMASPC